MKKILLLSIVLFLFSCGKDEVIIEYPIPPTETDELFEVNIIGFVTDEAGMAVPDASLDIDGKETTTDASGFFYMENVIIGRRGKVALIKKEGYLTSVMRVGNHNSLEDVSVNFKLVESPTPQTVSSNGGSVTSDYAELNFTESNFNEETRITIASSLGSGQIIQDGIYVTEETEFITRSLTVFIDSDNEIVEDTEFSIRYSGNLIENIEELDVFYFDEGLLTWRKQEVEVNEVDGDVVFSGNRMGFWALGKNVPAVYGELALFQNISEPLSLLEAFISLGSNLKNEINAFTDSKGSIYRYFPEEVELEVSLNDGAFKEEFEEGFSSANESIEISFNETVLTYFDGGAYACDFTLADGYVALLSPNSQMIRPIQEGVFDGAYFEGDEEISLKFYSNAYDFINTRNQVSASLSNGFNRFLACSDLNDNMMVLDGAILVEDFEECRVKVNPKETLIIGERDLGEVFLVSFSGNATGEYEGLIYSAIASAPEVQSNVTVTIVLYDEEEDKVGGFVLTENKMTGEEVKISFIGNIE